MKNKSLFPFLATIALPVLVALIYLLVFAQPTYETEAKLIVRENQGGSGAAIPGFAAAFLGGGVKTSYEDALILQEYLHSAMFIEQAAGEFDLRRHFADAPTDPFRRLAPDAAAEDLYRLFRKMVSITTMPDSSILVIKVRTFLPQLSNELATFIIEKSEERINGLNARMVASQTTLAKQELDHSRTRLAEVREKLLQFQIANAMVDPEGEATSYFSNIATLDSRLVEKRTRLRTESHYLQEEAYDLRRLRQEIQALEEQRREETRLLVAAEGKSMATTLQGYENLKMEQEFALAAYTSAFALMEKTQMEASRQEKFLLVISPPHLPEKPVFPKPLRGTLTVIALSCIIYGISRLIVATVRDHTV